MDNLRTKDPIIYCAIKKHMNNESKVAAITVDTLLKEVPYSRGTIFKSIKRLEKEGYLKIQHVRCGGNLYEFNNDKYFIVPNKLDFTLPEEELYYQICNQEKSKVTGTFLMPKSVYMYLCLTLFSLRNRLSKYENVQGDFLLDDSDFEKAKLCVEEIAKLSRDLCG